MCCGSFPNSGLVKIQVDSIADELSEEDIERNQIDGDIFICTICDDIRKDKGRKESIYDCLSDMAQVVGGEAVFSMLEYKYEDKINTVLFPKPNSNIRCETSEILDRVPPRVMIQRGRGVLDFEGNDVNDKSIKLLCQQHRVHMGKLVGNLYLFRNNKMVRIEEKINSKESHLGKVIENKVHLPSIKDNEKMFIDDIKGSDAYMEKNSKANTYMQQQNGLNHVSLSVPLFTNKLEDQRLAATLLRLEHGIEVKVKVNVEETGLETYSYFVPCENSCHDECENSHQSALDKATEMNCGSSNRAKLTICRYLQSVVNIFINKVIAKNSEFYDAHLVFSQDGSVHLDCSIWIKELVRANELGIQASDSDINLLPEIYRNPEFIDNLFQGIQGSKIKLENNNRILRLLEEEDYNGQVDDFLDEINFPHNFRDASLLEFLTVYIPGFKTHWSNQGKAKFDLRDVNNELIPFRSKNPSKDENEEVFAHENGSEYIKVPTLRRKYILKPETAEHLPFIQVGCNYRLLEKRRITQQLMNDLENSNGVLYRNDSIPVITNEEKYPNRHQFLPSEILLSNKQVLRLKKCESLMLPNVKLTPFGLRVLIEPFSTEEELHEEPPPPLNVLAERLKLVHTKSNFVIE